MENNQGGRPTLTREELQAIVHKLEPHLKSGKAIKKACLIEGIPPSTVYKYYHEEEWFMDSLDAFLAYSSNLVNNLFFSRLVDITRKDQKLQELRTDLRSGKIKAEEFDSLQAEYQIDNSDWDFIKWYALNAHTTRGEYGTRMELTGEGGKDLLPESPLREVATLLQQLLNPNDELNDDTNTGNTDFS